MTRNLSVPILLLSLFFWSCNNGKNEGNKTALNGRQAPPNIILMIGDGMGLTQISAGMIASGNTLELEQFPYVGLIKTSSSDELITDSAAGATAFSTGEKTYNGAIGVNADKVPEETILEIAARENYATGLIATSSITHATPASFYSHQPSRSMNEAIAMDMLQAPVDLFMGGGKDFFDQRDDKLNLLDSLRRQGFKIYSEVASIPADGNARVACFIAEKQPKGILEGRGDFLPEATSKALDILGDKDNGFFLMIEGSQIDWGGHGNNSEKIIAEMKDFDRAIGVALDFAEKEGNTLVVVTADHETGGYAIVGGNKEENTVKGAFTTTHHTAALIPVFAYGTGAERFAGIYENTAIFDKMLKVFQQERSKAPRLTSGN